jgi:oxygen-independent coproporphyrinogen-3 oxidase
VIERIMCDYRVDLGEVCARFGADPDQLADNAGLERIIADGVARREGNVIMLDEDARPLVRVLAAAFDEYLGRAPARHSRAV